MGRDTTPETLALAKESAYFSSYFAPARTTARAIFSLFTGIPDINQSYQTSSRNPFVVNHGLILNEFKGYAKFYCLGGNASWANIRGFLEHNVDDLVILEEGAWKASNVDVWGISDLDLFRESHEVLEKPRLKANLYLWPFRQRRSINLLPFPKTMAHSRSRSALRNF